MNRSKFVRIGAAVTFAVLGPCLFAAKAWAGWNAFQVCEEPLGSGSGTPSFCCGIGPWTSNSETCSIGTRVGYFLGSASDSATISGSTYGVNLASVNGSCSQGRVTARVTPLNCTQRDSNGICVTWVSVGCSEIADNTADGNSVAGTCNNNPGQVALKMTCE
jgi:hypothetical protein